MHHPLDRRSARRCEPCHGHSDAPHRPWRRLALAVGLPTTLPVLAFGVGLAAGASEGNDTLAGPGGVDRLSSGGGNDVLWGDDRVFGGAGADRIVLGDGPDRPSGGPGNDVIHGTSAPDAVDCGPGQDVVRAAKSARGCEQVIGGRV